MKCFMVIYLSHPDFISSQLFRMGGITLEVLPESMEVLFLCLKVNFNAQKKK